jgi:hypothetical protein
MHIGTFVLTAMNLSCRLGSSSLLNHESFSLIFHSSATVVSRVLDYSRNLAR